MASTATATPTAPSAERDGPHPFRLAAVGRWFCVELTDDAGLREQLRHFAREAAGVRDDLALFRADARRRLFAQAIAARGAGATHQFFCLELMPGVPMPASFTVFWPLSVFDAAADTTELVGAFEAWCSHELSADGLRQDGGFLVGKTAIVRRSGVITSPLFERPDLPVAEQVRADFWVHVPDTDRVALFAFQSPLVLEPERILALFTVMMCSLTWSGLENDARGDDIPTASDGTAGHAHRPQTSASADVEGATKAES